MSTELGKPYQPPTGISEGLQIPDSDAPQKQLQLDENQRIYQESAQVGDTFKTLASSSDGSPGFLSEKIDPSQLSIVSQKVKIISLSGLNTDSLSEGVSNKYYSESLFNASLSSKTSDDIAEGVVNKYLNQSGFDSFFSLKNTDNLPQGSSNKYLDASTSADISSNTAARHSHANKVVLDTITSAGSGAIITTLERSKLSGIEDGAQVNPINTDSLAEGIVNLYYTNARVDARISIVVDSAISSNVDVIANTAARHTHVNKVLLDEYTNSNASISNAIANSHTHSNKSILDQTEEAFTTSLKTLYDSYQAGSITGTLFPLVLDEGILSHDSTDGSKHIPSNSLASEFDVLASNALAGSYEWKSISDILVGTSTFEASPSAATNKTVQSAYINNLISNSLTDLKLLTDSELNDVQSTFPSHIANALIHLPEITGPDVGKFLMVNGSLQTEWSSSSTSLTTNGDGNYLSVLGSNITQNLINLSDTAIIAGANITIDGNTISANSAIGLIDETPISGNLDKGISSDWAYTHENLIGNSGHIPSSGSQGHFLSWDGSFKNPYSQIDIFNSVIGIQDDAVLDPGVSPAFGDKYVILDSLNLNANFGSISGLENNDIVIYNGSSFEVLFDASTSNSSISIIVTLDNSGNPNRSWYYDQSGGTWEDSGPASSNYWSRNSSQGTVSPLNASDYILMNNSSAISWGSKTSAKITSIANNTLSFYTNDVERINLNTSSLSLSVSLAVDTINEKTADTGVSIDNVLLKDNEVTSNILNIVDNTVRIEKDGGNNLLFTDPISGSKTLAELLSGGGDMLKATYDPTNINGDAFARANHTGTQLASTISDFDTEVSNNADVTANTAKVSADGSIDTHSDVDTTTVAPTNTQVLTFNSTSGKWEPADASGGAGGHTIRENGVDLSARTGLNFVTNGGAVTDDAGNDETDVEFKLSHQTDVDLTGVADGDLLGYNGATAKHEPQPTNVLDNLLNSDEANLTADVQLSIIILAGYKLDTIIIKNTTANAVTGGIDIGTTASGNDVVSAEAVGANAVVDATIAQPFWSDVNDTDLYISAVTAWNSANLTIYITTKKVI